MPRANHVHVRPFNGVTADVTVDNTELHLPASVDVQHVVTNPAVTLTFGLAGDVNGDRGALHLEIQLLVPADPPTDFLLG